MRPAQVGVVEGLEFLGRYDGSGYAGEQFLLRRPDGQVLRLSQLLYLVVAALAESSSLEEAAARVTDGLGRTVTSENVSYLIENKLADLGVIRALAGDTAASPETTGPARQATQGAFALRFRRPLLPARAHLRVTRVLQPLFRPAIVMVVLAGLAGVDAWLLATGGSRALSAAAQTVNHPLLLLFVIGAFCVSNIFHEFGHAAATTYGGATPGPMGVGVYVVMPVFYTDVTDAYRLDRRGRLRVDLGGVYFNVITAIAVTGAYAATGFGPLLLFAVLVQLEALLQFLPFVRLDGYYVVADLIGIPDPFAFVRPVLARLVGRPAPVGSPGLALLTLKARRAITSWVLLTVPILATETVVTILMAPTIASAFWRSLTHTTSALSVAVRHAHVEAAVADVVSILLLAVAPLGISLLAGSAALRAARALRRRPVEATPVLESG